MTHYCNHCKTNCDLLPYQDKVMAMATGVTRWAVKCRKCNQITRFFDRVAKAYEEWDKDNPHPAEPASEATPHTVEDTLKERAATHGKYPDHAQCTQELKEVVRRFQMSWSKLTHCQREALDMILHKIGRVIAGNADHADHWHDIAGYATLVEQDIKKGNVRVNSTHSVTFTRTYT